MDAPLAASIPEAHAPHLGDEMLRANGVDLCVEALGERADPAILLIHGAEVVAAILSHTSRP